MRPRRCRRLKCWTRRAAVPPPPRNAQADVTQLKRWQMAQSAYALLLGQPALAPGDASLREALVVLHASHQQCEGELLARSWDAAAFRVAVELLPQLRAAQTAQLWAHLGASACARAASPRTLRWLALYAAVGQRDGDGMLRDARALLAEGMDSADQERFAYLVASAMLAALAIGEPQAALEV